MGRMINGPNTDFSVGKRLQQDSLLTKGDVIWREFELKEFCISNGQKRSSDSESSLKRWDLVELCRWMVHSRLRPEIKLNVDKFHSCLM